MYVAGKRIRVQGFDGSYGYRNEGEPVPEAVNWTCLNRFVDHGTVRWVEPVGDLPKVQDLEAQAEVAPDAFGCSACDRHFKTLSGLRRHRSTVHKKIKVKRK